jgi:hypothetical protein
LKLSEFWIILGPKLTNSSILQKKKTFEKFLFLS